MTRNNSPSEFEGLSGFLLHKFYLLSALPSLLKISIMARSFVYLLAELFSVTVVLLSAAFADPETEASWELDCSSNLIVKPPAGMVYRTRNSRFFFF